MATEALRAGGAACHAAIAMSGIELKITELLPKHEISNISARAPTFLVHGLLLVWESQISIDIDLRIVSRTWASVILSADTEGHEHWS